MVHSNKAVKYHKKCSAKGCKSTDTIKSMRLFKFPNDSRLRQQWIDLLKVTNITKNMFACMLHYDESLWICRKLKIDTLPMPVKSDIGNSYIFGSV